LFSSGTGIARFRDALNINAFEFFNPFPLSDADRKQKIIILEGLFSSELSQFKGYPPSGNLKFNNLGLFAKLKIAYFSGKNPS